MFNSMFNRSFQVFRCVSAKSALAWPISLVGHSYNIGHIDGLSVTAYLMVAIAALLGGRALKYILAGE
jgi:hypothetical protein